MDAGDIFGLMNRIVGDIVAPFGLKTGGNLD
jgi:hypothetical protein